MHYHHHVAGGSRAVYCMVACEVQVEYVELQHPWQLCSSLPRFRLVGLPRESGMQPEELTRKRVMIVFIVTVLLGIRHHILL